MTLDKLMSELHYISNIEQTIKQKIRKDKKLIEEIAESAYQGEDFKFALCEHVPLIRLAVVTYLLLHKYDDYKLRKIPENIIFDTFRDVALRANTYYDRNSKVGISEDDVIWFRHIMNIGIFKIGTLQFQPYEMIYLDEEGIGEPYMTFIDGAKNVLPSGTPVLNCHIQQGADLNYQEIDKSIANAKIFFLKYFPDVQYKAFLCYSWLLYPPMLKYLSEESNIVQFANRFKIIGSCNDPEQAITNLFPNADSRTLFKLTSLQKMAMEHADRFGYACGIILI